MRHGSTWNLIYRKIKLLVLQCPNLVFGTYHLTASLGMCQGGHPSLGFQNDLWQDAWDTFLWLISGKFSDSSEFKTYPALCLCRTSSIVCFPLVLAPGILQQMFTLHSQLCFLTVNPSSDNELSLPSVKVEWYLILIDATINCNLTILHSLLPVRPLVDSQSTVPYLSANIKYITFNIVGSVQSV